MYAVMSEKSIDWPKVVLFGDSLTERSLDLKDGFWGALLACRLTRICDVLVRGFSGYNTKSCKVILPRLFTALNISDVEAFVICLGANDSSHPQSETKQHVPLPEYHSNLVSMINYLQDIGLCKSKIVLMTPPPYCKEVHQEFCMQEGHSRSLRDNETVSKYADACCMVGKEQDVEVLNLYKEVIKDKEWQRYLIDGLHFSSIGSKKVYELLLPCIERRVELCKILPPWKEVHRNSLETHH